MRKLFSVLTLIIFILSCTLSFASVGVRLNGTMVGTATDINLVCGSGTNAVVTNDGSIYNLNCSPNLASVGIANGGATSMTTLDSVVPIAYSYVRKSISSLALGSPQTGTLANGYPGQLLTIQISQVFSGGTFTLTPTTTTGFVSVKFTAAKDEVILLYVNDTIGWIILSYDGSITITP